MDGKYVSAATFWIVFCFFLVLLIPTNSEAVPARPVIESLTQPDGTVIPIRQFGDEWSNGIRTQDGYTILLDETSGFWVYAEPAMNGVVQKSPWIVGHHEPLGLPKRLPMAALLETPLRGESAPEVGVGQPAPNLGAQPLLVIFVDFTPSVRVGSTAPILISKFFGAASSVKDYYEEVSYGNFTVVPATESDTSLNGSVGDGIVSVVLNYPHPDTGSTIDDRNRNITRDALIAANSFVDFSLFDANSDGVISPTELHIVVIVAGYERSFSSSPCGASVWGHRWALFGAVPAPVLDGKVVGGTYTQFGEWHCSLSNTPGHAATIGIMVHELGHDLGLPDLYDIDLSSEGIGEWGVMGGGSWNGVSLAGDSPAHMDPWSKYFEGWISPTLVSGTLTTEPISQAATTPDVYQFLSGTPTAGEYFLVENRQKTGYDAGLPGTGLLIWHIDASKNLNTDECYPSGPSCAASHYKVAVVQADNLYNLEKGNNRGDAGDPWPGSTGNRNFTDVSAPDSDLYSGTPSNVSITNISNSGSTMTATLAVVSSPTVTINPTTCTGAETGPAVCTLTVSRTGPTTSSLTVNYALGGSAGNGVDYQNLSGNVTISSGFSSAPITVTPIDDSLVEGNETVIVTLASGSGYTVGSPNNATVTITDNDSPVVTITATDSTATEAGPTTGTFTVSRTGPTTSSLTVNYTVGGTAANGTDYTTLSGSVTILSGSATAPITVTPIDDSLVEGNETVIVTLASGSGYTVGSPNNATVTITDNDSPVVTITATDSTATEAGPTTGTFTVSRTGPTTSSLTVSYTVSGTATNGSDYQTLSGSVTIPGGSSSVPITVTPIDDSLVEGNETVVATLASGSGYTVGSPSSATVTITDNDSSCPTTPIALNSTASGSLTDSDCDAPNRPGKKGDRYTFSGTAGEKVNIAMNSSVFDSYVILVGPTGAVVAFDDDSGPGTNSLIINTILPDSGNYTIEATAFSASGRGTYTLSLTTSPFIRVLAPNGGEHWQIGSTQNIQWTSNFNANVKVLLSRNGGQNWNVLSKGTANDGNWIWKVKGAITTNALIKVCRVKAPTLCDTSDSTFTILP